MEQLPLIQKYIFLLQRQDNYIKIKKLQHRGEHAAKTEEAGLLQDR